MGKHSRWIIAILVLVGAGLVIFLNLPRRQENRLSFKFNRPSGSGTFYDYWKHDQDGYTLVKTPPPCPEPLTLSSYVDTSLATSVLYPGQMRSVGYENTSGFRFDGLANDAITITAPLDGDILQAARFTVGGELQYVFDIYTPCGIMVRFDHVLELPPKLQNLVETLPPAKENDNRSTFISPPVRISKGEVIGTAVGLRKNNNAFISMTMFDFRKKNKISHDPTWAKEHPEMDHYALCPFTYLPQEDQDRIAVLPAADSMSGSQSDFCEE